MKDAEAKLENREQRFRLLRHIGTFLLLTGILTCLASYTARTLFSTNLPPFLPPAGRELQAGSSSFRLAAFGDFGAKVDSMEAVVRSIGGDANFAICLGDMMRFALETEYGHVVSELRAEMDCPLWTIPGNHDLGLLGSMDSYHRFFGQDFYYWSYADTLFIALNTAGRKLPEEQRLFLKQTLANQRERYRRCVIVCHIPPVDLRPKASHCLPAEETEAFRKIISEYKIDLIISGHIHRFMEGEFAGIRLVHLPSSGQAIRDPDNRMFGYVMFDFAADGSIAVKQVDVTAETGREMLEYFASTVLGGKTVVFLTGLSLIVTGIVLLTRLDPASDRNKPSSSNAIS